MNIFKENELTLDASCVTIGAFDGLHLGHQALVKQTVNCAKQNGVPSVAYTFNPPPRALFQNKRVLTSVEEKVELLKTHGIDYLIIANFNKAYASKLPFDFIHELKQLHPMKIIVGPNFKFGKNKQGDTDLLAYHYNVHVQNFVRCEQGRIISSTRIRGLIEKNQLYEARKLLGRTCSEKIKL